MFEEIIKVEPLGKQMTYDIEVDSEDHNFYANDICVSNSHSYAYAQIAVQTLYLKHYYPTEFYVSLLNNPKNSNAGKDKEHEWLTNAIASAIAKGIEVHPPNRNSNWHCTIVADKEISLGLSMVNGFGDIAYEELTRLCKDIGKDFSTITAAEFFALPFSKYNKTAFDACLKTGMFDDWSNSREYLQVLRTEYKKKMNKKKKDPNQMFLFGKKEIDISVKIDTSKYPPTSEIEKIQQFEQVCGFNLGHIHRISSIRTQINKKAQEKGAVVEPFTSFHQDGPYYFIINDIRYLKTKMNKDYVELTVGDGVSTDKIRLFEPMASKVRPDLERKAVYMSSFTKNDKGFVNIKRNAKLKKIVHANSDVLIEE